MVVTACSLNSLRRKSPWEIVQVPWMSSWDEAIWGKVSMRYREGGGSGSMYVRYGEWRSLSVVAVVLMRIGAGLRRYRCWGFWVLLIYFLMDPRQQHGKCFHPVRNDDKRYSTRWCLGDALWQIDRTDMGLQGWSSHPNLALPASIQGWDSGSNVRAIASCALPRLTCIRGPH